MTDAINTNNRLRSAGVSADTKAGTTAKAEKSASESKSGSSAAQDSTIVELSSSTVLEELSEQIKNLPEVNEAKIEAIKQALTNGEYKPDAEVIARKYSEIEKLLP